MLRIGNSLGVTLPAEFLSAIGLSEGQTVRVEIRDGRIEIEPERSIAELLDMWDPIAEGLDVAQVDRVIREDREAH